MTTAVYQLINKIDNDIIDAWKKDNQMYPRFIRHLNKNVQDNRVQNLKVVSINDALNNLDWKVDWVCGLSKPQIRRVIETVISETKN